ncbi:hypothetical protein AURDEDRAFT_110639 [Auricularia subglabra TFB-10046 SS5]|nr:hypothetical protein AURDEDRAFT_110639 [Auricularia subglabra TFB-10046 SS5]
MAGAARDDEYYFEDGSLILLVENALFNVHPSRLTKASSVFADMLALPSTGGDGSSDENPIMLHGDSSSDIRALLWALYVSPEDLTSFLLSSSEPAKAKCDRLLRLCTPAHKYAFTSLEAWALQLIRRFLGDSAPHPFNCDVAFTTDLLRAAHRCGPEALREAADVLYAALEAGAVDPAGIVLASDTFDIAPLAGLAYYRLMAQGMSRWRLIPSLSDAHRARLLAGHHNLSNEWRRLREAVCVPRAHASRCCANTWSRAWMLATGSARVRKHDPADILELCAAMKDVLRELLEHDVVTHATQSALLAPLPERCTTALLQSNDARMSHAADWYKAHFAEFFALSGDEQVPAYGLNSAGGLHMLVDVSAEDAFLIRRRAV